MAPKLEVVHEKSKRYDWHMDYARPQAKFPTRYIIPPKGKDPFRVMLRDYARMETEKDNRVLGGLDSDVRYRNANLAEPRWIEVHLSRAAGRITAPAPAVRAESLKAGRSFCQISSRARSCPSIAATSSSRTATSWAVGRRSPTLPAS